MNNEFPEQHMLLSVCTTQQSQRLSRSCCTCTPGPVCNIRINCCSSINVRTLTIPIYVRTKKKTEQKFSYVWPYTHTQSQSKYIEI